MTLNQEDGNSDLSLEQQFGLKSFESMVEKMSLNQAQEYLVALYKYMLRRDNIFKTLIKSDYGYPQFNLEELNHE
jgi:UTP-glucose-1-phosphate uridylyltransferase